MNFASTLFLKILICYVNIIFSVMFDIKTIFFVIIYVEQTRTVPFCKIVNERVGISPSDQELLAVAIVGNQSAHQTLYSESKYRSACEHGNMKYVSRSVGGM